MGKSDRRTKLWGLLLDAAHAYIAMEGWEQAIQDGYYDQNIISSVQAISRDARLSASFRRAPLDEWGDRKIYYVEVVDWVGVYRSGQIRKPETGI